MTTPAPSPAKEAETIAQRILRPLPEGYSPICKCNIGFTNPECPNYHNHLREQAERLLREPRPEGIYRSVAELCAKHDNLAEYIGALEVALKRARHSLSVHGIAKDIITHCDEALRAKEKA